MNKYKFSLILAFSALLLVQISGCKKQPVDPPIETEVCNPTSISYVNNGRSNIGQITYNSAGNPISMIISAPTTGNTNAFFKYDQYGRLTEFITPYGDYNPANPPALISFQQWVKYTYADQNANSLPVADTTRAGGIYDNGVFTYVNFIQTSNYTYDSKGRIIKVNNANFTYDANGNLTGTNLVYDDKKNYQGGNKILMFVNRDYSVNNPFVATTYNVKGLPTVVPNPYIQFLYRYVNVSAFDYTCSVQVSSKQ